MTIPTCDVSMCSNRALASETDDDGRVRLLCAVHAPDLIEKP